MLLQSRTDNIQFPEKLISITSLQDVQRHQRFRPLPRRLSPIEATPMRPYCSDNRSDYSYENDYDKDKVKD